MGSPRRDETLVKKIKNMVTEPKQKYIFWKLGLINNQDWDTLSERYLNGKSLEWCDSEYKTEEDVQKAMRFAMKVLHEAKMIELYNIYFERAKEDVQSFKAFIDFSEKFFAEESESELMQLLNGIDVGGSDE